MFDILEADIVIMQEAKIQRKDLRDDMVLVPGWDVYFSLPKQKKGELCISLDMGWTLTTPRLLWRRNIHPKLSMLPHPG